MKLLILAPKSSPILWMRPAVRSRIMLSWIQNHPSSLGRLRNKISLAGSKIIRRSSGSPYYLWPSGRLSFEVGKCFSPVANVVWGRLNFMLAFLLFANFGPLYIGTASRAIFVAAGMLFMGVILAPLFSDEIA